MSLKVVGFTNGGVVVADGAVAAANLVNSALSGEAVVFVVRTADNAAPVVDIIKNANDLAQVTANVMGGNLSANVKEAFASALGLMAAIPATAAWGPAAGVGADYATSEAFKSAYDAASAWSRNQDWGRFFDWLDSFNAPELSPAYHPFDLDLYLVPGIPSVLRPICISPTLGTTPDPLVKTIHYVDPLILDLDGDGLEITPLSQGILFDANGDTIKTGTAWAGADDGMLVWDRNGNGTIDNGAELFGDETVLAEEASLSTCMCSCRSRLKANTNYKFRSCSCSVSLRYRHKKHADHVLAKKCH